MIERTHAGSDTRSFALYSDCERYRYALTRIWDLSAPKLLYIMLNPSKATEVANDPTVERCERRAKALGYGAFRVCNLFAWRETDPKRLRRVRSPEGPENRAVLVDACGWADTVLCGWGTHGAHRDKGPETAQRLRADGVPLYHLGLTKHGHPRHPLYVAYSHSPLEWHV